MARKAKPHNRMATRIKRAITHAEKTYTEIGRAVGVTRSAVSQWVSPEGTEPTPENLRALAKETGVNHEWLALNRGRFMPDEDDEGAPPKPRGTPLLGYVRGGAEAEYLPLIDDELDYVDPIDTANEQTRALEIRGKSMGAIYDRWIVFFDDTRMPVTPDLIGRVCVIRLADGRTVIKKLESQPNGLYRLVSEHGEPIVDAVVEWASAVKLIMDPRSR